MTRELVNSSDIEAIDYDPFTRRLKIEFKTGKSYLYFDVPDETVAGLREAVSTGGFFHANIRSNFEVERLEANET